MTDYLKGQIEQLKQTYPDHEEYIESSYQSYLSKDGPTDDDGFYFLLKGFLAREHPGSQRRKPPRGGGRGPDRRNRR